MASGAVLKARKDEIIQGSIPRTPRHGKSIASHSRRTLALDLICANTSAGKHLKSMVEKLVIGAVNAAAAVVVLKQELESLRQKNMAATDSIKVQSRKVLLRVRVVSASVVVQLRENSEKNERERIKRTEAKGAKALA